MKKIQPIILILIVIIIIAQWDKWSQRKQLVIFSEWCIHKTRSEFCDKCFVIKWETTLENYEKYMQNFKIPVNGLEYKLS